MQFARNVHFQVKSGKEREFTALFENEVIPMLRKQPGFREYFTLSTPRYVLGIIIWDDAKSAEKFTTTTYPAMLAKLNAVIDGPPKVETYDVTSSRHFTSAIRAW
jgi:heme-degrading monooxygenase HmoA